MEPTAESFSLEESIQEIERQVDIATGYIKEMEKYDGIWTPNAIKGVSLPLTDGVVVALHAILGNARQIRSNKEKKNFHKMEKIIPWSSLPKWVYNQRVSDKKEDLPYWYRDTDGLNNFYVKFVPLPNDPHIDEINIEGGVVEIFAMSKHQLLAALRAYKKTFNRFYADDDYWDEYGKAEWEEYENDKKHNGGPSDFYSWKKWKKEQKKGKVTKF